MSNEQNDAIKIPKGYPSELKKKEIKAVLNSLTAELIEIGLEKSPSVPRLSHRSQLAGLMELGQGELDQRRTRWISGISIAGMIVSIFIAFVALNISSDNQKSSDLWMNEQFDILKSIESTIDENGTNSQEAMEKINSQLDSLILRIKALEEASELLTTKPNLQ